MKTISKFLTLMAISSAAYIAYGLTVKSLNTERKSPIKSQHDESNQITKDNVTLRQNVGQGNTLTKRSNDRTQLMYKDLGMTEAQRRLYEEDYKTLMEDWKRDNPNTSMDDQQSNDNLSAALKAVLNEDQFAMYRDWDSIKNS